MLIYQAPAQTVCSILFHFILLNRVGVITHSTLEVKT